MPQCPICNQEYPEEELLEGIGPCFKCKDRIDQEDFEEERKAMEIYSRHDLTPIKCEGCGWTGLTVELVDECPECGSENLILAEERNETINHQTSSSTRL